MKRTVPPGSTMPAETSAAIAASSSASASPGEPRGVTDLRAVAEHAERAGERGGRRRQPRQAEQHRVGDAARDDRADLGRRRPRWAPGRGPRPRRAARRGGTGCRPSPRGRRARTDRRARSASRAATSARDRRARQRRRAQHLHGGIGDQRRRLGRQRRDRAAGWPGSAPSGCPSSRRAMNASARADGASHHCRSSTTSTSGESAERFEASQYRPCCHA